MKRRRLRMKNKPPSCAPKPCRGAATASYWPTRLSCAVGSSAISWTTAITTTCCLLSPEWKERGSITPDPRNRDGGLRMEDRKSRYCRIRLYWRSSILDLRSSVQFPSPVHSVGIEFFADEAQLL